MIIRQQGTLDVETASLERIASLAKRGFPLTVSYSGGKDSIVILDLVLRQVDAGVIPPDQLTVIFVDEEAIFPCIERNVLDGRRQCLERGIRFLWLCLPFKHFSCFDTLTQEERFVTFDPEARDVWIRQPPEFAVTEWPGLVPGKLNYQEWSWRAFSHTLQITGIRNAESLQRAMSSSSRRRNNPNLWNPIYDWSDRDVWYYIDHRALPFPEIYRYLWEVGTNRRAMRVSQFFSVDTAGSLVQLAQFYPDLMTRILRRQPNAYLATLYWDSEMFRRRSTTRRKAEKQKEPDAVANPKARVLAILADPDKHLPSPGLRQKGREIAALVAHHSWHFRKDHWQKALAILVSGDPKNRSLRALRNVIKMDSMAERQAERERTAR